VTPVLTPDKLETYAAFDGDRDGYARCGPRWKNPAMTDDDWAQIDEILTGLDSVASGRASAGFIGALEQQLQAAAPDPATRMALRELAVRRRRSA
jgi:hypothetical protein